MDFWSFFWPAFFLVSLLLFATLAIVVTIGGFFNIRSLFKSLADQDKYEQVGSQAEDKQ